MLICLHLSMFYYSFIYCFPMGNLRLFYTGPLAWLPEHCHQRQWTAVALPGLSEGKLEFYYVW